MKTDKKSLITIATSLKQVEKSVAKVDKVISNEKVYGNCRYIGEVGLVKKDYIFSILYQ